MHVNSKLFGFTEHEQNQLIVSLAKLSFSQI